MKLSKLTLAVAAVLGASLSSAAFAIDLYVDSKTKQIFAEPGKNRVKMGSFEQVKEGAKQSDTEKKEIAEIRDDLALKDNAIKALEEKVVAAKEDKAKNDEKWFNKINIRGYTQFRYTQPLSGAQENELSPDRPLMGSVGDGSIGNNKNFLIRRMRLVFSGDINDYVSVYIQPDFATGNGDLHFAQLRDAYADIHFDKAHEYRIRAGQSKIPFGWENLQSSQNRLTLDRSDALNSAVPSERDLGLMAYWTPSNVQKLWKKLSKDGLKTSGDYGVLGLGVYNGQGINKAEVNDSFHMVAHSTYPLELDFLGDVFKGQVLEVGADAMSGRYTPTTAGYTPVGAAVPVCRTTAVGSAVSSCSTATTAATALGAPRVIGDGNGTISEDRVGVHAVLFPQPFGLQAEWTWGKSGALDTSNNTIRRQSLNGGYVQAMYKIDKVFGTEGTMIPYAKIQRYDGAWKGATNSPFVHDREVEAGVEYQIMKALEVTLAYSYMDRTQVGNSNRVQGDMVRAQLQWNY